MEERKEKIKISSRLLTFLHMPLHEFIHSADLESGPYIYELFSVMIHSGSANGGHYYAYIKSLSEKQWYSFNDQHVQKITPEEVFKTFGNGQGGGRSVRQSCM